jgi:hypothetical protein
MLLASSHYCGRTSENASFACSRNTAAGAADSSLAACHVRYSTDTESGGNRSFSRTSNWTSLAGGGLGRARGRRLLSTRRGWPPAARWIIEAINVFSDRRCDECNSLLFSLLPRSLPTQTKVGATGRCACRTGRFSWCASSGRFLTAPRTVAGRPFITAGAPSNLNHMLSQGGAL